MADLAKFWRVRAMGPPSRHTGWAAPALTGTCDCIGLIIGAVRRAGEHVDEDPRQQLCGAIEMSGGCGGWPARLSWRWARPYTRPGPGRRRV